MRIQVFLLLLPLFAQAQNEPDYGVHLIPPSLLKDADAVVRSQEITFTVSAPDEAVWREKRVVTLFNNKSRYDVLVLFYDGFKKIGKIRGSIYDSSGRFVREVEKKEIEDHSAIDGFSIYTDNRVRYVDVNHDTYPYTVVFEYEIKYRDLLDYPDWEIQEFNTAVEQASYTLMLPNDLTFHYKSLNISLPPTKTQDGGKHSYGWEVKNLPPVKYEPYAPSSYELLPHVFISPDVFKADGHSGSMASWKVFGQFLHELAKGRDELSPALKAKVHTLTDGLKTDSEKISVLYRYLQENTRYVSVQLGIGGWQPFDAQYVEKNKYGDCKALSNFMKALLREAGIASHLVVVYSGSNFLDVPEDLVVPSAFNHMILYVPSEGTWLECTSPNSPPNYLGAGTDDREVLLITEQGGQLARTPAMPPSANHALRRTEIFLKATGEATIKKQVTLSGSLHEWYRYAAENLTPDELRKKMQEGSPLPQAYFTHLNIKPQKETPEVFIEYALDIPQFGSKAGKRLFLPINPLNAFNCVPSTDAKRVHPVVIDRGYAEQDTIVLHLPEGCSVESVPTESTVIDTEFGSYAGQIIRREADRALLFVRRLEIKPVRLPAERYGEWRNFCRDVAKADGMKVVLVNKT